ncbi:MAG: histone deacetylase [Gammaproteobacteria bacterium]|nr:histone deacetylase [Gammaproteobacteria bacterium]
MNTSFVYNPLFLNHDTGTGHPERSARLTAAHELLTQQTWYGSLLQTEARIAESIWIDQVHEPHYEKRIRIACRGGESHIDTPDVMVSSESYDVAIKAAGGVLEIADRIMSKEADNGFAMVRPPGHHAEADHAMGFCLFNNIAVAARYLQKKHGLERVLILDWDVHHGNGTQHIFETDPSVFYISLHQSPHYPGTGARSEQGIGKGQGATLNCPMSAGMGEMEYREAFREVIMPKAMAFRPDIVLISAGFDAHAADPLGSIALSTSSYGWMTQMMMELADKCCDGRLISVLEGGYDLDALAQSVTEHLRVLSQNSAD